LKKTGKLHSGGQVPTLLVNGEKLNDPMKVATAISDFFITVTEK